MSAIADWTALLAPGITTIGVVAAALVARARGNVDHRASIKADLDIVAARPKDSTARKELLVDVERRIVEVTKVDDKRQDPAGVVLGLIFIAIAIWLGFLAAPAEGILRAALVGGSLAAGSIGLFGAVSD